MNGDLVLYNGHILTMNPSKPLVSAIGMRAGKIAAVGSLEDVLETTGSHIERIDLQGRTTTPGLIDAHAHPMMTGLGLSDIDISSPGCSTIADITDLVSQRTRDTPPDAWVIGRGYDHARLYEQRHPTRADLDQVSPNNPVLLIRACHHIGVANSKALELAGISASTQDPEGGSIDRDEHGIPTGVVREAAYGEVSSAIPEPTESAIIDALQLAGMSYLQHGVTSATEAGIWNPTELSAYQRARSDGSLPVRTYLMMMIEETLDELVALGIRTGFGDEWLRIGPAKLFSDGSIGGHTARMRQPYEGSESNIGLWMQEPEVMKRRVREAHRAGFQIGIHAIGDAAIDLILDAYEEANADDPRPGHRHRIEHCSVVDLPTIERIAKLEVIPIPGTSFLYYFRNAYAQNLGIDRLRYTCGTASFESHGIPAAASSDAPVVPQDPATGLYTMMVRRDVDGIPIWPEESVPLETALKAYTANGAYASFEEGLKGSLAPGMVADIAVFETNLANLEPEAIIDVNVDLTIIDGSVRYERPSA